MGKDDQRTRKREEEIRKFQDSQSKQLLNPSQLKKPINNQPTIKIEDVLKVTGLISFVADCIAIFVFILQLLTGQSLPPLDRMIGLVVVIILAFIFSLLLMQFSGGNTDSIFSLFGMIYAVYGGMFFSIISYYSISEQATEIDQLGGYFILAMIIAVFCYVVIRRANIDKKWAALPYIFAGIFHIGYAITRVVDGGNILPYLSHVSLFLDGVCVAVFLGIHNYLLFLPKKLGDKQ